MMTATTSAGDTGIGKTFGFNSIIVELYMGVIMKHVEEIERLKLKNEMLTVRNEMLYNSNAALIKGNEKLMDLISVNARTLLICGFLFSAANVLMFTAYYYK